MLKLLQTELWNATATVFNGTLTHCTTHLGQHVRLNNHRGTQDATDFGTKHFCLYILNPDHETFTAINKKLTLPQPVFIMYTKRYLKVYRNKTHSVRHVEQVRIGFLLPLVAGVAARPPTTRFLAPNGQPSAKQQMQRTLDLFECSEFWSG